MGALPDQYEPPVEGPRRDPAGAPPLRAVPRPAPGPEAPTERTGPPAPPSQDGDREQGRTEHTESARAGEQADQPQQAEDEGGLDLDRIAELRSWARAHLRVPDVWNAPAPALSALWSQTLAGAHLPSHPLVQVAERMRVAVSLPLVGALCLLAWCLTSAARTAALAVAAAALWMLGSTLVSAAAQIL